ncbi:DHA1 family bicyclomycin/chloramphenicol resistance-like MFS transporter [Paucibacter oligotrophus]|uniref:Bcr/CflA family efflux transporter n=1 Tax=Roseateles oligotrophus TaxID=1769250 RepID=A0A840LE71_9BURK|nr:multidrug effflux MFS transporter [Roseateles oligotrophus]MBB4845275.1 DHA1 family bicyclomycin/chloramphenicol resistance-like MFS transporter [Roseateles oligotrophus]
MNPQASTLWRAPRWALAVLLAALGMIGPFSIDTYLPAFAGIATALNATPVEMQQTLSSYLLGFAVMNLFHGALSDSFGRRPVVLWGMAAFTLASVGCALAGSIGQLVFWRTVQGMSAGAGIVVSRAIIRDMFAPSEAQRVMSQVTIFFGVAPAIAPMIGGFLFVHSDWHSIFWFLVLIGASLFIANWRLLPETLHEEAKQPFHVGQLLREYGRLCTSPRFILLALASGIPFNGMFLYVLSAPVFVGEHLGLAPTQFFWFFCFSIGGIMGGAWLSGRLAGKVRPRKQIRYGFVIMGVVSLLNVMLNLLLPPNPFWALPVISAFAFGWALMVPVVTLLVLDEVPERRGLASSLQACIGSAANGLVAGLVVPLVMHSTVALAFTSMGLMGIGLLSWTIVKREMA